MSTYDFNLVCIELLKFCEELGRIPKKKEIDNNINLPTTSGLVYLFKTKSNTNYGTFCKERDYSFSAYTFETLKLSWQAFYKKYNRFPTTDDYCDKEFNIPSHQTIMKTLCDRKDEFFNYFSKIEESIFRDNYNQQVEKFKLYCIQNERIPVYDELVELGFPSARWFIRHSIDDKIEKFPNFIESLGLKPHYRITKDVAIEAIHKKAERLGRNPMYEDFYNPNFDEIGINVIKRIWGNFNSMLKDLGFEINQENMMGKARSIEEMKEDIKKACECIERNEGRKNISFEDIDNLEFCLSPQTYAKHFKEKLDMSLAEYILSLGFIPNKIGMGMIFEFEDGEVTKSKFEYDVSMYLKENKHIYRRDVQYKEFIDEYKGNKDCDYVIKENNILWYVEVAGMLDYSKGNENDFIRTKYKRDLKDKEIMLKSANLNYKIIYPKDLRTKPLDEVFSFLF